MRLQSFAGRWRLDRTIEDARAGRAGRLTGEARFEPVPGGLAYVEDGTLAFPGGAPVRATRRYLWRERGGIVEVRFEDGRPFHGFDPEDPTPDATHDCPPDLYRVRYDFRAWPDWRAEWRVSGPRKDYRIVSAYVRLDGLAPSFRDEHERAGTEPAGRDRDLTLDRTPGCTAEKPDRSH